MTRDTVVAADGSLLNTCSSNVLIEVLRYLKRAYWPFPWDTGVGDRSRGEWAGGSGFFGAAEVCMGMDSVLPAGSVHACTACGCLAWVMGVACAGRLLPRLAALLECQAPLCHRGVLERDEMCEDWTRTQKLLNY